MGRWREGASQRRGGEVMTLVYVYHKVSDYFSFCLFLFSREEEVYIVVGWFVFVCLERMKLLFVCFDWF